MALEQILTPADAVHVLQEHLDLAANEQALKSGIVGVHVLNVELFHFLVFGVNTGQGGIYIGELAVILLNQGARADTFARRPAANA